MAIERYTIGGDLTALATALEALGEDFFATVTASSSSLSAQDADGNTIFGVNRTSSQTQISCYRGSSDFTQFGYSASDPKYLYKCGSNGAIITFNNTISVFVVIAKDKNGRTAFTTQNQQGTCLPVCWGDGIGITNANNRPILISTQSNSTGTFAAIGYHCLFVPVPLLGTYEDSNYFPKLFMMPIAQASMRGVEQIITDADGTEYFTNGYLALMDDSSETT